MHQLAGVHYVPFPIFATFISQGARERFFFLCGVQVFSFSSHANLSFPKCWIRELWVCDGVNTKNTLSSLHPLLWLQRRAAGQRRDYGHQTYSGDEVCHIRGVTLKEADASVNPAVKPKSIYIPPLLRICVFVVVGVISRGEAQKPCLGFCFLCQSRHTVRKLIPTLLKSVFVLLERTNTQNLSTVP